MPALRPDPDLVQRAVSGEPEAVHDLLAMTRPLVLNYCRRALHSWPGGVALAEDVTQETCVALAAVLPRYTVEVDTPFGALVFRIAANKTADAMRSHYRSHETSSDEHATAAAEPDWWPTPEEAAVTRAELVEARRLLGLLGQRDAHLILLRAKGYDVAEVAALLDMEVNAVRVAHHRALKRLRALVEPDAPILRT